MNARGGVITDCIHCPHLDHRGAFGEVAYVPQCHAVTVEEDGKRRARVLPHTVRPSQDDRRRMFAIREPGIPDWCPLPNVQVMP